LDRTTEQDPSTKLTHSELAQPELDPNGMTDAAPHHTTDTLVYKSNYIISIVVPIIILVVCGLVAYLFLTNKPQAEKISDRREAPLKIEAKTLHSENYPILIRSFGVIQPRIAATLIPQVAGMIVSTSPNFREGGTFQKGEALITLDDRDYKNSLIVARASFTQAQFLLKEEQARTDQAKINWQRLGKKGPASELVLRLPQLSVAQAALASAKAQLNQRQLDLERTRIIAPYAGRVLNKSVDVGQVVSQGVVLASIYATDTLKVRLPINSQQLQFLDIPNDGPVSTDSAQPNGSRPKVMISASSNHSNQWQGEIVRAEGAIDTTSRQLFVIAQISPNNGPNNGPNNAQDNAQDNANNHQANPTILIAPPKIGQFVAAEIQGKTLTNVFVIPRANLYQGDRIWLVEDNKLVTKLVHPIWKNDDVVLIRDSVMENALLVTTPLLSAVTGRKVSILNQSSEMDSRTDAANHAKDAPMIDATETMDSPTKAH